MANLLNRFGFPGSIAMAAIVAEVSVAVGLGGVVAAQPSQTASAPQTHSPGSPLLLKSVSVELPTSDRTFPDGPGSEEINNNCLACHSAGMVLNQPAMPKAAWESEVHKMVSTYKAPVSDQDATTIIAYLTRIKGAP